ncbi:hypothetical protein BGW39_010588 [Mortierella sp. 14UC]|nr:hypothetical protein BGW39_010588 [Mortierella sp. 14UC]
MTVGRLSQTVGVHAQWIKQQETSPRVAIEEAGREAIAQMDQKCEKLIKSIVVEAEMVIQRIEETSRRWKDSSGQLQAAVDTMQGVSDTMQEWLRQVQASQELIIQEAIAALQRTVADQLKRNDEAVEMASQRAIGLLEQRGDDMIKSMTTHAEVMVRRMEEMPKRWKESLPDHRDTVPEAIPAMTQQTQHEQGPSWSQEMDAWMTRFDARFSSEFKTIKDAATAQSQVLNAYIQCFLKWAGMTSWSNLDRHLHSSLNQWFYKVVHETTQRDQDQRVQTTRKIR